MIWQILCSVDWWGWHYDGVQRWYGAFQSYYPCENFVHSKPTAYLLPSPFTESALLHTIKQLWDWISGQGLSIKKNQYGAKEKAWVITILGSITPCKQKGGYTNGQAWQRWLEPTHNLEGIWGVWGLVTREDSGNKGRPLKMWSFKG